MIEYIIEIGNFRIPTILLFLILFILIYLYTFWFQSRRDLKNNPIFDIGFITLLISFLVSRFVAFLADITIYLERGWSILPLSEGDSGIELFATMPWAVFNFFDNNFEYIGILLGLIIGLLFIYQNSNQKKTVYILFDRLVISYAIAAIVLHIGMMLAGIDIGREVSSGISIGFAGANRFPLHIVQIVIIVVFLIVVAAVKKTRPNFAGIISSLFLIMFGISEFLLRTNVENYSAEILGKLDLHQAIALIVIAVGVLLMLPLFNFRSNSNQVLQPIQPQKQQGSIRRNFNPNSGNRFVMSFSDKLRQDNINREERKENEQNKVRQP